jgi:hypothetical protein
VTYNLRRREYYAYTCFLQHFICSNFWTACMQIHAWLRAFTVKRHTLLVNRGTALRSAPSLRVRLQTILALAQGSANAGSDSLLQSCIDYNAVPDDSYSAGLLSRFLARRETTCGTVIRNMQEYRFQARRQS